MFERLLELHSTEVPNCACGKAMRYVKLERRSEDAAVKHFQCDDCERQFLLMVWPESTLSPVPVAA